MRLLGGAIGHNNGARKSVLWFRSTDVIRAEPRQAAGKGGARKLRAAGFLPAVVYGPKSPGRLLVLDPNAFLLQRQQYGASHLYNVAIDGGASFKALIKHIDVDPLSRKMLHADLYEVDMANRIRVEVPIELIGKPAGLIDGGMLSQILRQIEVEVLPDRIPEKIQVDVSPLKVGDSLHLSDMKLPPGVRLTAHNDEAVALLAEPEKVTETVDPAAGAAGASGASGASAAGDAAAKAPAAKK